MTQCRKHNIPQLQRWRKPSVLGLISGVLHQAKCMLSFIKAVHNKTGSRSKAVHLQVADRSYKRWSNTKHAARKQKGIM